MQRMGIAEEQLLIKAIHKDTYIVLLSQKGISEMRFLFSGGRLPWLECVEIRDKVRGNFSDIGFWGYN